MADTSLVSVATQELAPPPEEGSVEMANWGRNISEEKLVGKDSLDAKANEEHETGLRLIAICISLALAVFCVALDNTIIATAIPRITDDFHAIDDVAWYGSAYFLSTCSLQLFYARLYTFYNVKWVFLCALFIFEVGSLVCGVAPTSNALIVGRAVAGLGAAGIFNGALTVVAHISSMHLRPIIIGGMASLYPFSNVIGPLLGGAFTENVSWRWCFYINLPIGGLVTLIIFAILHVRKSSQKIEGSVMKRFDPVGNILFIVSIICLLLAVEWGGTKYAYSDARIIVLFTFFGLLIIAFIASQAWLGENATIPTRVSKSRSIRFGGLYGFCIGGSVFVLIYYLPIYFQAIQGVSAVTSAVHTLPMIIAQLLATFVTGALTSRIGHYMPFVWIAAILLPIGAGLFTTYSVDMPAGKWIGYQIIYGLGVGAGFQQCIVAVQSALPLQDIAMGVAVNLSSQQLGGTILLSAAQNVFTNHLRANFAALAIPGFDPERAIRAGATQLRNVVPAQYLHAVLVAYAGALDQVFRVSLIMACLMTLGAAGMEWRSMRSTPGTSAAGA